MTSGIGGRKRLERELAEGAARARRRGFTRGIVAADQLERRPGPGSRVELDPQEIDVSSPRYGVTDAFLEHDGLGRRCRRSAGRSSAPVSASAGRRIANTERERDGVLATAVNDAEDQAVTTQTARTSRTDRLAAEWLGRLVDCSGIGWRMVASRADSGSPAAAPPPAPQSACRLGNRPRRIKPQKSSQKSLDET